MSRRPTGRPAADRRPGGHPTRSRWATTEEEERLLPRRPDTGRRAGRHPRDELRVRQNGLCAACLNPLTGTERAWRDRDGTRVAALLCWSCLRRGTDPVATVDDLADPLLALRLVQGPHLTYPDDVAPYKRSLMGGDWSAFARPTHALFVHQGGRCGLNPDGTRRPPNCRGEGRRHLVLDHDHETGLVRGLLCYSCNTQEGKAMTARGPVVAALLRYAAHPPADTCPPTHDLPYSFVLDWPRPRRPGGPVAVGTVDGARRGDAPLVSLT